MAQFRVERGGRFIKQHHLWLHRQRAGNGHTLLLAAGEFRRIMMRALGQADFRQQIFRLLLCRLLAGATYPQRAKHHVFQRRQVREQVKLLEHHPGFLTNQTFVHLRIVDL